MPVPRYLCSTRIPGNPEKWWDLVHLLEAISGVKPRPNFDLVAVTSMLRNNLTNLIEALGPNLAQTTDALERQGQERLKALRTRNPLHRLRNP